eukprot:14949-Heterococcus_DN1.PRE.1
MSLHETLRLRECSPRLPTLSKPKIRQVTVCPFGISLLVCLSCVAAGSFELGVSKHSEIAMGLPRAAHAEQQQPAMTVSFLFEECVYAIAMIIAFRRIFEATESLASTAANRDYLAAVIAHAVLADAQERQKYDQNSMQEDGDIPASSSS